MHHEVSAAPMDRSCAVSIHGGRLLIEDSLRHFVVLVELGRSRRCLRGGSADRRSHLVLVVEFGGRVEGLLGAVVRSLCDVVLLVVLVRC